MTDSERTEGGEEWQDLHKMADRVLAPGIKADEVVDIYNRWASRGFDQIHTDACSTNIYGGLKMLQQAMLDLYSTNRDTTVILDVGAGTGIAGQLLRDIGFKIMDGLDPAPEMLRVAQEKKMYRNTYTCYLTGDPTDIPAYSYDCITMVGVFGPGHLPCAAFEEMNRIVKPGGYIVNCARKAFLVEVPEYKQNWEPLKEKMEREGRWNVLRMETYPNHFLGNQGT